MAMIYGLAAFISAPRTSLLQPNPKAISRSSELEASRRKWMSTAACWVLPTPALADLDFERVQDLLKDVPQGATTDYSTENQATSRPKWLTEPTDEFKENERKSGDFKRLQLQRKQEFTRILEKLQNAPPTELALTSDLDELRRLIRVGRGLPLGIKREDVVKQVRRRKAQKFWPVNVEIA